MLINSLNYSRKIEGVVIIIVSEYLLESILSKYVQSTMKAEQTLYTLKQKILDIFPDILI